MAVQIEPVEPPLFTNVTPTGIEVAYSPSPRRHYKVRHVAADDSDAMYRKATEEWQEVPSVTEVLKVLDKPGLPWWGMKVGVEGVCALYDVGLLQTAHDPDNSPADERGGLAAWWTVPDEVVRVLTANKLTVNHTLSNAGDRGTSVHDAFEDWAVNGTIPHPEVYPETERPYVEGLVKFIRDWSLGNPTEIQTEVMVGSIQHEYAGRYDYRSKWAGGCLVARTYPKRANRLADFPAGKWSLDLKTSSGVYQSHALQLAAYEAASVECGYEPTDYQAVIHVTKTGEYEFVRTTATLEDFLSIRGAYETMRKKMLA